MIHELLITHDFTGVEFYLHPDGKLEIRMVNMDSDVCHIVLDVFEVGQLKDLLRLGE